MSDWTEKNGKSNSSDEFYRLVVITERIIRGSAHDLIAGDAGSVALLIIANLAHGKDLAPPKFVAARCAEIAEAVHNGSLFCSPADTIRREFGVEAPNA